MTARPTFAVCTGVSAKAMSLSSPVRVAGMISKTAEPSPSRRKRPLRSSGRWLSQPIDSVRATHDIAVGERVYSTVNPSGVTPSSSRHEGRHRTLLWCEERALAMATSEAGSVRLLQGSPIDSDDWRRRQSPSRSSLLSLRNPSTAASKAAGSSILQA
jgi:hypothetical protein